MGEIRPVPSGCGQNGRMLRYSALVGAHPTADLAPCLRPFWSSNAAIPVV
jgi:hypothetical protein